MIVPQQLVVPVPDPAAASLAMLLWLFAVWLLGSWWLHGWLPTHPATRRRRDRRYGVTPNRSTRRTR